MIKMISYTALGFVLFAAGFFLTYLYFKEIDRGYSFLLLISALALFALGGFSLFRATKSNYIIGVEKAENIATEASTENKKSLLERNNEISNEWAKTNESRDKLKMLKLVAEATEKK